MNLYRIFLLLLRYIIVTEEFIRSLKHRF